MASEPREVSEGPASGFLDLGTQRLEYRRTAARSVRPPTLLLLHEGLGSADGWWPFADALAAASGCPVFAYYRAGYGRSSPVALPRPLDYLEREAAEVLPRVLDAAGIGRAVLVGHSDGATIAALAAASEDPRISGAVLIAPHVVVEAVTIEGVRRATKASETGDLRQRLATQHLDVAGAFRGWSNAWLDPERCDWDVRMALRRLTVPLLLIQGEMDRYGTTLQIDAVAQSCPHTEVHYLQGLGHAPQDRNPTGIVDIILEFILNQNALIRFKYFWLLGAHIRCDVARSAPAPKVAHQARMLQQQRVAHVSSELWLEPMSALEKPQASTERSRWTLNRRTAFRP